MIRTNRRFAAVLFAAMFFVGIFPPLVYAADTETEPSPDGSQNNTDAHFTIELSIDTKPENGKGFQISGNGILQEPIQFAITIMNDGNTDLTDFHIRTKPVGFASYADGRLILKPGESRKYKGKGDDGFIIDSEKLSDAEYLHIKIIISCKTITAAESTRALKKTETLEIPITVLKRGEKRTAESPRAVESSAFTVIEDEGTNAESVLKSNSARDTTEKYGLFRKMIAIIIILSVTGIIVAAGMLLRKRSR